MSRTWKHGQDNWLRNDPKWWRKTTKHRPRRRDVAVSKHKVLSGDDPETVIWPLDQRPRKYYW